MRETEPTLLSAAWRFRWLVIVVTTVTVALGLIYYLIRPSETMFQADATVLVQEPTPSGADVAAQVTSDEFIQSQLEIIRSPLVAEAAAALVTEAGIEIEAEELTESVTILGSPDSPLVTIQSSATTPEAAVAYTNSIAEGYREVSQRQATATSAVQLERLDAQIESIDQRLTEIDEELTNAAAGDDSLVRLRQQADNATIQIADLQDELVEATPDEAVLIRDEIADYRQVIAVYSEVQAATAATPTQRALLEEQTQQVNRRAALLTLRDEIEVDAGLARDALALVQPAVAAEPISGLGLGRILAVSLILGLAAGVGLAYFLSVWRRAFTARSEPEPILGAPLLAEVPDFEQEDLKSATPVIDYPRSAAAEAFRFAAASIEAAARGRGLHSVFAVSSTLGHGKTTTVVNTAMASAIHGLRVMVLDCDFGNQETSRLLGSEQHSLLPGITDVVDGAASVEDATHWIDIGNGVGLSLMSRGTRPGLAATSLQSKQARELFVELAAEHDLILIDGPPLLQVAYASTLAELADGLVVLVEHQGSQSELEDLTKRLKLVETPVLGYVYNRSALRREMVMSEGSMMDILGDGGFAPSEPLRRRRTVR